MSDRPAHTAPVLHVVDDALTIGGCRVDTLVSMVGGTPFYAYDREVIAQQVRRLREALPESVSLHYAIKANPMPAVVEHIASLVDGLDIASIGEMQLALDSGTPSAAISFAGPGKRDIELEGAIASGVTVNLESVNELDRALHIADRIGVAPHLAIRVNPDFELKRAGMAMGGGPKPFGIDAEIVPDVIKRIIEADAVFRGLQIYSGSQNLNADLLIEAQRATFALADRLATAASVELPTLNIGGGFGIPYFPGERLLDLEPIADALAALLKQRPASLHGSEVILELGRFLIGESGAYVCRVIDRKVSRGRLFIITDGGMHQHLAASGNLGQLIRKNYPVVNATQVAGGKRESATVVGPLCTPLDVLADQIDIGELQVGDLVAVLQSGAYGLSASPLRFLGHPPPKEILV